MTKRCDCGKTKTIQPFNASGTMSFICDACAHKVVTEDFNTKFKPIVKNILDEFFH